MSAQLLDLGAKRPDGGSRILTAWRAARESERRQAAAAREHAAAIATFRRHGGGAVRRTPIAGPGAQAEPAFPQLAGQRAFAAAGTDRLSTNWVGITTGINADLEGGLPALVARSRDWWVNTDLGARFGQLVVDNVIGSEAPRLQVRARLADGTDALDEAANQAVEDAWAEWCRSSCDIAGRMTFGDLCRANIASAARDGEFLTRQVFNRSLMHGMALQLLDVDRIYTQMNQAPAMPGGNAIRLGVEVDRYNRPVALYLTAWHPGDPGSGDINNRRLERVPAAEVLHGFVTRRPEQVRGYPWAASILKRAQTLDAYETYAVQAAKIGAAKMGFYTLDKDAVETSLSWDEYKDATGELIQDVEAGMLESLPPGVDFKSFDPDYPHQNFQSFVSEFKRDIAAGVNVAHHNLTGNMSGVNYSSARIAELQERRHWRGLQVWFINAFVRPVFENWLTRALLTGSIRLPSGATLPAERFEKFAAAASFQPPGWPWVDPQADIDAAATAMSYDLRSLRQIADEQGVDLEDTLADKARLKARYEALGLPVPAWLSGANGRQVVPAGAAPAPAPAPAAQGTPA